MTYKTINKTPNRKPVVSLQNFNLVNKSLRIIQVTQNVNKDATMLSCTIKSVFSL